MRQALLISRASLLARLAEWRMSFALSVAAGEIVCETLTFSVRNSGGRGRDHRNSMDRWKRRVMIPSDQCRCSPSSIAAARAVCQSSVTRWILATRMNGGLLMISFTIDCASVRVEARRRKPTDVQTPAFSPQKN